AGLIYTPGWRRPRSRASVPRRPGRDRVEAPFRRSRPLAAAPPPRLARRPTRPGSDPSPIGIEPGVDRASPPGLALPANTSRRPTQAAHLSRSRRAPAPPRRLIAQRYASVRRPPTEVLVRIPSPRRERPTTQCPPAARKLLSRAPNRN